MKVKTHFRQCSFCVIERCFALIFGIPLLVTAQLCRYLAAKVRVNAASALAGAVINKWSDKDGQFE